MTEADLCLRPATELAALVRGRELSAAELLAAHLAQIERLNPRVNAICTLDAEGATAAAAQLDTALAAGADAGPLAGLPVVVKDLVDVAGLPTTCGSPIYRDAVAYHDDLMVQRMRAAGAVIVGKSNVPEFGAGSHTFNTVFGVTRNPYDLGRSAGGSSGGGAAALTSGMVAVADGSDYGGSIRNPPNFNSVVGLRPTPGRGAQGARRPMGDAQRARPHGTYGGRRRAAAERDRRPRPARPDLDLRIGGAVRQSSSPRPQGLPGRLQP